MTAITQQLFPALPTPAAVSDFYASALKYRLHNDDEPNGADPGTFATPSLEKVQAISMLVVHEWGMCRGAEAYVWLGIATRMAMVLGLSWDDVPESPYAAPEPAATSPSLSAERGEGSPNSKRRKLDGGKPGPKVSSKEFTEKEVRRRTFWALFMLDRSLSSGRLRPSGIPLADAARVRLPCEERGFLFGEGVRTGFLTVDGLDGGDERNGDSVGGRWEVGEDEGILARVVRITEIWGRVQEWACAAGGRR